MIHSNKQLHSGRIGRRLRRLPLFALFATGALAIAISACGSSSSNTGSSASAQSAPPTVHLYTTILTGGMINNSAGSTQGPKYVPADMTVPAGARVVLTIISYDDGPTPFPNASSPYLKVSGGTETIGGSPITSMSNSEIAHTFTIPSLGINAVIPAAPARGSGEYMPVTVTFTFTASHSGSFTWECLDPCGSGSDGMGGAMATPGYMKGTLTVA